MGAPIYTILTYGPTIAAGDFQVAHGLSHTPHDFEILQGSPEAVGEQSPASDGTYIYLWCSDSGATGKLRVW